MQNVPSEGPHTNRKIPADPIGQTNLITVMNMSLDSRDKFDFSTSIILFWLLSQSFYVYYI